MEPTLQTFYLLRHNDVSGVSGTGIVAEGVVFRDGTTVIRWLGDKPSTVVWGSIADAVAIHGHGGNTEFVFNTTIVNQIPERRLKVVA